MQNLFKILNLPAAFELNLKTLEQHYFTAQRQWHPDRFVGKDRKARDEAATRSMLINDAYDTLKDPLSRATHLLALQNIHIDEDSKPPADLLAEMMELRERIHENADDGKTLLAIVDDIKKHAGVCSQAISDAFTTQDYKAAEEEALRLGYLGKAMEEAHTMLYRLKAQRAGSHH